MDDRPKTIQDLRNIEEKPVVISDDRGFISHVNDAFVALFEWSRDELIGEPLSIIIPENLREAHNMGFSRFLASGEPRILNTALNLKATDKNGREFDAEHYIVAEKIADRWAIGSTIEQI